MKPVTVVIATNPQVIPLNHLGEVGAGVYASGGTLSTLADNDDVTSIIAAITGGVVNYPADGILVAAGVGETVIISQYG